MQHGANGIDVSNNNGQINLSHGFSGLKFVFAKATEGVGFIDNTLPWYHTQARNTGSLFGTYHFGHPEQSVGASEGAHYLEAHKLFGGPVSGMPLWYDYEATPQGWESTPDNDANVIYEFITFIKNVHRGAKVGIYSNLDGFGRILPIFGHTRTLYSALWLAEPNGQIETPDAPLAKYGESWTVHQYETFAGIDRNYSRASVPELMKLFTW